MDGTTFSSATNAMRLVEILEEANDSRVTRRISSLINGINMTLKSMDDIADMRLRWRVYHLYREDRVKAIDGINVPNSVKTHTYNVVNAIFKNKSNIWIRMETKK